MADENSNVAMSPSSVSRTVEDQTNNTQDLIKSIIKPQSQINTIQLDESNYLLWKFHIETAIRGYGLQEYVYGTLIIPPRFSTDNEEKLVNNKDYITHERQDSLISSWLLSSVSANLMPQLVGCKTAHEIWHTIEQTFSSQSAARIMQYKRQLQSLRKDSASMRDYLSKAKTICDQLACAGHKVADT